MMLLYCYKCDSGELPHCPRYIGELPDTWLGQISMQVLTEQRGTTATI